MKKSNIYQDRSQELSKLFEQAGSNSNIMCIPIDYAKKDHVVMFCNGYGDILRKPFTVKNTPEGVKYLIEQATRSCRHRHVRKEHTFFGVSSCGNIYMADSKIGVQENSQYVNLTLENGKILSCSPDQIFLVENEDGKRCLKKLKDIDTEKEYLLQVA